MCDYTSHFIHLYSVILTMLGQTLGDVMLTVIKPLVPHKTSYDLLQDYLHGLTPNARRYPDNLLCVDDPVILSLVMEHTTLIQSYCTHHSKIIPSNMFEMDHLTNLRLEITNFQSFLKRVQHLSIGALVQLGMGRMMAVNFSTRVYGTRATVVVHSGKAFLAHCVEDDETRMPVETTFSCIRGSHRTMSDEELIRDKRECMHIWLLSRAEISTPLPVGVWIDMFNIAVIMVNAIQKERMNNTLWSGILGMDRREDEVRIKNERIADLTARVHELELRLQACSSQIQGQGEIDS